jgi:hypothetical protein
MTAHSFQSPQAMADYQAEREVAEAMAVLAMRPDERFLWLTNTWGRLQTEAATMYFDGQPAMHTARTFATHDEKNRFDDDRELAFALALSQDRN